MSPNRDRVVSVRLTESEYEWLRERAGSRRVSDLIRERLLSERPAMAWPHPEILSPSRTWATQSTVSMIWFDGQHGTGFWRSP
jgi:hypothetical protein